MSPEGMVASLWCSSEVVEPQEVGPSERRPDHWTGTPDGNSGPPASPSSSLSLLGYHDNTIPCHMTLLLTQRQWGQVTVNQTSTVMSLKVTFPHRLSASSISYSDRILSRKFVINSVNQVFCVCMTNRISQWLSHSHFFFLAFSFLLWYPVRVFL